MNNLIALTASDIAPLVALSDATGMFKPLELEALDEVLTDCLAGEDLAGQEAWVLWEEGVRTGFVHFAPAPMTVGTWHVYWLVIDATLQGQGRGARLMAWAEERVRAKGARAMFVETSGTDKYALTRRFYEKLTYEKQGVLREFYAPGDDMVVYRKGL
jgi:ribosomal protein S18 acetylase RimI-like enzyme